MPAVDQVTSALELPMVPLLPAEGLQVDVVHLRVNLHSRCGAERRVVTVDADVRHLLVDCLQEYGLPAQPDVDLGSQFALELIGHAGLHLVAYVQFSTDERRDEYGDHHEKDDEHSVARTRVVRCDSHSPDSSRRV